jgi:pilus assembly protein FimV
MVAAAASGFAAASTASGNRSDELNLDDLELDEPVATSGYAADDSFDLSLDDLDLGEDNNATPAPAGNTAAELDEFRFDELTLDAAQEEQAADDFSFDLEDAGKPASFEEELARFSLDLNDRAEMASAADLAEPTQAESVATNTVERPQDFDFELSDPLQSADMPDEFDLSLDDEAAEASPEPTTLTSELEQVEAELDELTRDLAEPVEQASPSIAAIEPVTPTDEAVDEDFDFFADTDETTTKLDLARAYIDMGDSEGARDILDEVMSEGSDTQQREAREMLAKLA